MAPRDSLLEMRGADVGLSQQRSVAGGWLECRAAGNRATLWLRREGALFLAAASPVDVASEAGPIPGCEPWNALLPADAAAGWQCATEVALDALCRRIAILGHTLPDQPLKRFIDALEKIEQADPSIRGTERERIVRERVGQDIFREALMKYWGGMCPISGVTEPRLLRASHAKPWKDCTDEERLDVHNGLLLAAHLDAAFDAGLISFSDGGRMLMSDQLGAIERTLLGPGGKVSFVPQHMGYLHWHRSRVVVGSLGPFA